jgi:hypothetical protein
MTLGVSFKEATKVAVCAICVGVAAPASIPTALAAIAGSALAGHFSVEFIDQVKAGYLNSRRNTLLEQEINRIKQKYQLEINRIEQEYQLEVDRNKLYKIAPRRPFDPVKEVESLKRAIARFKIEHPEAMQFYLKIEHINTEEGSIQHFQERLAGNCVGQTQCMIEIAKKEGQSFSPQMISKMTSEEVFYWQIVEFIYRMLDVFNRDQETFNALFNKLISPEEKEQNAFYETYGFGELVKPSRERKKAEFDQSVSHLFRDHVSKFSVSEKFSATLPALSYKEIFTKILGPSKEHTLGYVSLSQHRFAFQCTPEAYFIYDVYDEISGGLHKYPSSDLFFENLRNLAISDIKSSGKDVGTASVRLAVAKE